MNNNPFIIYGDHPIIAGMVYRASGIEPNIMGIAPGYLKKRLSEKYSEKCGDRSGKYDNRKTDDGMTNGRKIYDGKTDGGKTDDGSIGNTGTASANAGIYDAKSERAGESAPRIVIFEDECARVDISAMLMYMQMNDRARSVVFVRDSAKQPGDFTDEGECGLFSDRIFRFNVGFGERFIGDIITLAFFDSAAEPDLQAAEAAYWRVVRQLSEAYMNMASERGRRMNKGVGYFTEAISEVADDAGRINSITKDLYRSIGRRNGASGSCVERSMRHSLGQIWDTLGETLGEKILERAPDYALKRPTNSEFILFSAKYLRKCCPAVFAAGKLIKEMRGTDGSASGNFHDKT